MNLLGVGNEERYHRDCGEMLELSTSEVLKSKSRCTTSKNANSKMEVENNNHGFCSCSPQDLGEV